MTTASKWWASQTAQIASGGRCSYRRNMIAIAIRSFEPRDAVPFRNLNLQWIEQFFTVEPSDLAQLDNPQSSILDKGGYIAIAEYAGEVVGTGAVVAAHHQPRGEQRWMEVIKMATKTEAQGWGVGQKVLEHLIDVARSKRSCGLWLETNDVLAPALRLYKRCGFRALGESEIWPTPYARCNCQMILKL